MWAHRLLLHTMKILAIPWHKIEVKLVTIRNVRENWFTLLNTHSYGGHININKTFTTREKNTSQTHSLTRHINQHTQQL